MNAEIYYIINTKHALRQKSLWKNHKVGQKISTLSKLPMTFSTYKPMESKNPKPV